VIINVDFFSFESDVFMNSFCLMNVCGYPIVFRDTVKQICVKLLRICVSVVLLCNVTTVDACMFPRYITFSQGMQEAHFQNRLMSENTRLLYELFRMLYQRNYVPAIQPFSKQTIPKIIHHIWLGSKLPERYELWYQSWHTMNPEWQFVFWTDTAENFDKGYCVHSFDELAFFLDQGKQFLVVDVTNLVFENRAFFDASTSYGERSDILRYELLDRVGGLYVDTDFECLKLFDPFHHRYDLYVGIQPLDTDVLQLGVGLIGTRPGHPIMRHASKTIKDDSSKQKIVVKTGPIHFMKSFCTCLLSKHSGIAIAFPSCYFYPCLYEQRGLPKQVWSRPEAFAVHHWESSWMKPQAFVVRN